ncbi:MAG: PP2C family protein-serine/threonine phosphatase [Planctomycetota bacterium]
MEPNMSEHLVEQYDDLTARLFASRLQWLTPLLIGVMVLDAVMEALDPNLSAAQRIISLLIHATVIGTLFLIRCLSARLAGCRSLRMLGRFFVLFMYCAMLLLQVIYPKNLDVGASIHISVMLISCFMLPWRSRDATLIAALGVVTYTCEALKTGQFYEPMDYGTNLFIYGIVAFLAVVVKRDDENRRRHEFLLQKEIEEKNEQLERDLDLARRVQLSLVPQSVSMDEADVAVTYAPMYYIGGDYANFLLGRDGRLVFFMSDVSGHGVSAALVANRIHAEVERLMKEQIGPGELLERLDTFVTKQLEGTAMFLSAVSGVLDFREKKLVYSNHGHPPQILYQGRDGELRLMEPRSPLLGIGIPSLPPQESEADLPCGSGDRIFLFTDGVTETQGANTELFGLDRLKDFVARNGVLAPGEFNLALTGELAAFREGPIEDDIFLLTIRVK